ADGGKKNKRKTAKQLTLDLPEVAHLGVLYEYAVLVTSMADEVRTIAQHYRDRGDSENNFDELKNQWSWAGFTTHDQKRCQIMARLKAAGRSYGLTAVFRFVEALQIQPELRAGAEEMCQSQGCVAGDGALAIQ